MFIKHSSSAAVALLSSVSKLNQPAIYRSLHLAAKRNDIVKVPTMAESISEGTLKAWSKQVGDHVKADEEVAVIETDKIDVTVNAPFDGIITEHFAAEEDTVEVGNKLFDITPASADSSSSPAPEKKTKAKESNKSSASAAPATSSTKSTQSTPAPSPAKSTTKTETHSQPPTSVTTATPKSDAALPKTPEGTSTTKSKNTNPAPPPNASQSGANRSESRVKMNRMRLRIAERLKESQNTAASLTTFNTFDMSRLMSLRSQHKEDVLKRHGVKLGYMSAFAKAAAIALKEVPAANAAIEGDSIVYRDYVDLSVAVATPKGLVTPVIRNVEGMPSFVDIERAIADAGKKARDGKLTMEDMSGGTFTISNGGVFGSLFGTPIINLPQSAVLGMHAIVDTPIVVKNEAGKKEIAIRPVMTVALTYDHRLLDGREAVTLLVRIKQLIEDPEAMLVM